MTRTVASAEREISRIRDLPFGPARTRAAEAEVSKLTAEGPREALDYGLFALVEAYTFTEEAAKAFVPFTQLLRLFDDHPEYFDAYDRHSVFWAYKWMVGDLMAFPEVPAAQIESTLEDMRRRYTIAGNGMNAVRLMEFYWASERETPDLEERYQAWVDTPRDDFSQCKACEPGDRAIYLAEHGRPQEAVDLIEKVLPTNPHCGTEPADMLSQLALCYLDVGRPHDAVVAFYRAVAEQRNADGTMCSARGRHLEFLVRAQAGQRALRHIVVNEGLLHGGSGVPSRTLGYLCRVGSATATLIAQGHGSKTVTLRKPGPMSVSELHQWAWGQAARLAGAFDARNGNTHRTDSARAAFAKVLDTQPLDLNVLRPTQPPRSPASIARPAADEAPTPFEAFARAERLAAREPASAAGLYQLAAQGFAEVGDPQRAGYAQAEAAHCAQVLGDLADAAAGYRRALDTLRGTGVSATALTPIAISLIGALADQGEPAHIQQATATAEAFRAQIQADPPDVPGRDHALLRIAETHARLLATRGDFERAVAEAREVRGAYLAAQDQVAAASAAALAGRILSENLGRYEEAEAILREACEAYRAVPSARAALLETTGLLITALQAQGKTDQAQQVADEIS